MSCFSVGSVCHTSSFEVAVFQRVCESSFIVQVFAGVTASGTSSSFLSQPLWAFILKTLPSLSSWAADAGSWKAACVSCAFLSHFSFNTLIFQPHFISVGVILVVCLLNFFLFFKLAYFNWFCKVSREFLTGRQRTRELYMLLWTMNEVPALERDIYVVIDIITT